MWPNPLETADLVTFTEEILNGKLHFFVQWMLRRPLKSFHTVFRDISETVIIFCKTLIIYMKAFSIQYIWQYFIKTWVRMSQVVCRGAFRTQLKISKMKLFANTVNDFQPLVTFGKSSILDVWLGSEYASAVFSH